MATRVVLSDDIKQKLAPWYPRDVLDSVRVLRGSVFGAVYGRLGQGAITVNGTVHLTRNAQDLASNAGVSLLAHELFHVLQERDDGWWRYLARYLWHWRPRHLTRGIEHPMERAAYARGYEVRTALDARTEG